MKLTGVLMGILVVASLGLSGYLYMEEMRLLNEIALLQNIKAEHESTISQLGASIDDLESDVESLESDNEGLQTTLAERNAEVDQLRIDVGDLEEYADSLVEYSQNLNEDYEELQEEYEVEENLHIGNGLTSFYDIVRKQYGLAGDKNPWTTERDKCRFGASLAHHDLGHSTWPDQESTFKKDVGNNSYAMAYQRLLYVLNQSNVTDGDTPTHKIANILDFINDHLTYSLEAMDVLRAPVETLSIGSGDCDDYVILTSALFEGVGIDSAVAFFKDNKGGYHLMTLVHLESIDTAHYSFDDLTGKGLSEGRWIIIEPQRRIDYQGDEEWIGQWDLMAAAEVDG